MERKKKPQVIVSLTSFPGAIAYAPGAIRSVLRGSILPDKIVLYVTKAEFGEEGLPLEITELEKEHKIFEVRDYPRNIRSYRKLVPALREFPEDIVVTIDDDVDYPADMLKKLLQLHRECPEDIIAHRAKRILADKPYKKWKKYRWYHFLRQRIIRRSDTMQTGVGGVLYPPHSLKAEMLATDDLFTTLSPTADDIWFWAAAVANGRRVIPVPFGYNKPRGLGKPRELSLKQINFKAGNDRNFAQFQAVVQAFPELRDLANAE